MITINVGIRDQLHQDAKKYDPEYHWPAILKHEIVSREYRDNFCPICAFEQRDDLKKIYTYDARTDCWYKRIS